MKKSLIALLLLCLLLGACGQESAEAPAATAAASPAATETPAPAPAPESTLPLEISEAMSANKSTLADSSGTFPDWIELHNVGAETVSLGGCRLTWNSASLELPEMELAPGEYRVLFCSDSTENSSLSNKGERLCLLGPDGGELDVLTLPELEADCSFTPDGISRWPTPGYENSSRGYDACQSARLPGELAIGEAVVHGPDGDWVELWNTGEETLTLDQYCLSDKEKDRLRYTLPDLELEPGECWVAYLKYADFSLNAGRDQLYLSRSDGTLLDYVSLHDLPLNGSLGRMEGEGGFWYFAEPSPGEDNAEGSRRVAPKPESLEPDGVFEDVKRVTVTLSAPGEIYYTTDGSLPTAESEQYTKPIVLTETGVIRAVCIQEDALPSRPLSLSYILNEHHSLPVTSLVCEPSDLFGLDGIYDNVTMEGEVPGSLMIYDGEERFSMDCGVKPHGETSRLTQPKKTLKVVFKDCYEGQLHHDLFHNGVTDFASILLRAPREEQYSSLQRDFLLHELAAEAFPALPSQAGRYSILYINGRYWGVYSLREAHSAELYAKHYGKDTAQVRQYRGDWDNKETGFDEIVTFAMFHDMRLEENYRHVAERLDIDSVIGWAIMEAYCGNWDIHSDNMRFYYTLDDGKMHYALVDLDAGLEDYFGFQMLYTMGYNYNILLERLTQNGSFRAELLRQYGEAMDGPLAVDRVLRRLDEIADELRPEIPRDRERWGSSLATWEALVQRNKDYFTALGDYETLLTASLRSFLGNTPEWRAWAEGRNK